MPETHPPMSKIERHAPLAAGLAFALLTLAPRYLPMTDLPLHEGAVGLLRHFDDPKFMPHGLYVLNLGHPNQLFYIVAWLFSYAVSTSMACKLVVALSQVGMFVGAARLADHLGRRRWGALLVTPLALGFTYYWGLVANLVGFATLLLALPAIDRGTLNPSVRSTAKVIGVLLVLFLAHESIFVCAALIIGVFTILQPLSRKTIARIVPSVFAAALAIGHQIWLKHLFTRGQPDMPTTFLSFTQKLQFFPNVLFGSHELATQLLLFALALGSLLVFGYVGWKERASGDDKPSAEATTFARWRERLWQHRFAVVGVLHLIAYFAVPFTWHGATLIHERFLGPAWSILVVVLTPHRDPPRLSKILTVVLPVGVLLVSWPQFLDADRSYRQLDAMIDRIPYGATVTQASIDRPKYGTRVFSASTGPARVVADRGGRSGLSLAFSPIAPVMIPEQYQWNEYNIRVAYIGSKMLIPSHDLHYYEWLITQSRDPAIREAFVIALSRDAELVTQDGEYMLFHSKYPIAPILSPDDPAAFWRDDTLYDRIRALVNVSAEAR